MHFFSLFLWCCTSIAARPGTVEAGTHTHTHARIRIREAPAPSPASPRACVTSRVRPRNGSRVPTSLARATSRVQAGHLARVRPGCSRACKAVSSRACKEKARIDVRASLARVSRACELSRVSNHQEHCRVSRKECDHLQPEVPSPQPRNKAA